MPETVLVSIECGGRQADFELPARVPLKHVERALLEAVRSTLMIFPEPDTQPELRFRGIAISKEWTLEQCGVFDGSILQLILRGKGRG